MKKMFAFAAAALTMGSAGFAQSWNMGSGQEWTPARSASAYPPCSGAKSDDRCIQLYERGVRTTANLAMNRDTTGTATAATADDDMTMLSANDPAYTGQGGPYEPVDGADLAAMGMPMATSRSGYPPCPRSDAADSCIQLYERGVTGQGN